MAEPEHVIHQGVGARGKCRSCPTLIIFAESTNGKLAPFEEDADGLWVIENGKARHLGHAPRQLELGEVAPTRYTNHFARCPAAAQWRKDGDR